MLEEGCLDKLCFWNSLSEELIIFDMDLIKDLKVGRPRWKFPNLKQVNLNKKDDSCIIHGSIDKNIGLAIIF
jgi:hypothetical protein